jgi:DNA-binding IscR family transcriptional regulator
MAALGNFHGEEVSSKTLAESLNANPNFVRKSLSKLSKVGLVVTTREKNGASELAHAPKRITLLDLCHASAPPAVFLIHSYPWRKGIRSVATLRNAWSGSSLKLGSVLRIRWRKYHSPTSLGRFGKRRFDFFEFKCADNKNDKAEVPSEWLRERNSRPTMVALDLYDPILKLCPDRGNRGALWSSVSAIKTLSILPGPSVG